MRIVVSDDSQIVRDRVKAYCKAAGHEVVGIGKNGKEGYDLCAELRPDIAIFDVSMPVMNGDVAAMAVKSEGFAKYVVLASSQIQAATLSPVLKAGISMISKPFAQDKFTLELSAIISNPPKESERA